MSKQAERQQRDNATFWAMAYMHNHTLEKDDPQYEALTDKQKARIKEARQRYIAEVKDAARCSDAYLTV